VPFLLAERAHSESARSMRAVKGNLDHSLEQISEPRRRWSLMISRARATRGRRGRSIRPALREKIESVLAGYTQWRPPEPPRRIRVKSKGGRHIDALYVTMVK
jgi:hypothetical protein